MGEEATGVDVERRVSDPQAEHTATDLIRSMALSSAELWHDVLQRLAEVQESQVILARAVADVGAMVKSISAAIPALDAGRTAALGAAPVQLGPPSGPLPGLDSFGSNGGHPFERDDAIAVAGHEEPQDDPVGPLPDDVIAAFFPPENEVAPWYKRRVSLRLRRRHQEVVPASFEAPWPSMPAPSSQPLPPPPPQHLLDQYTAGATAPEPVATPEQPEASDLVASFAARAMLEPEPATEEITLESPVGTPERVFEPGFDPAPAPWFEPAVGTVGQQAPLAPQALVYTPSNAETSIPFESVEPLALDEPIPVVAPVAIPFELDPPEGLPAQGTAVVPPIAPQPAVGPATLQTPVPVETAETAEAAEATATAEAPEPAPVGAIGGRPVVEAQMSVSMATEILGSAAAAAPSIPPPSNGEPAPLVISEDLTIVSKHHRNRKRLQFRLR